MLSGNSILILAPLSITCIFTGILGGTFGVGGGFIIVPVLNFLLSIFYKQIPNTMAVATSTSMCSILITMLFSTYKRKSKLLSIKKDLIWIMPSTMMGGIIGSFLTKIISNDFLHIVFPCYLTAIILLKVFGYWLKPILSKKMIKFHRYHYPFILIPTGTICIMCGIGTGAVIYPLMMSILNDTEDAAAISCFNTLLAALFSLLFSLIYPYSYNLYPIIYFDIYLPMVLTTLIISPIFSNVGIWINSKMSAFTLDISLLFLMFCILIFQIVTF